MILRDVPTYEAFRRERDGDIVLYLAGLRVPDLICTDEHTRAIVTALQDALNHTADVDALGCGSVVQTWLTD